MRRILFCAMSALVLLSCKKDNHEDPPSNNKSIILEKSTLGNQTFVSGETNKKGFEFIARIRPTGGLIISDGTLRLTSSNGVSGIRNITVVISNSTGEVWRQKIATVGYSEIPFKPNLNVADITVVDTIKVLFDSDVSATGTISSSLELGYVWNFSPYNPLSTGIGGTSGQTVTFVGAPTLATSLHVSTPLTGLILEKQEDTTLVINASANGGDLVVTQLSIATATPEMVETVFVYDGVTLLGKSLPMTGSIAKIAVEARILNGNTKMFTIKVQSKAITAASQSRANMKTSLTSIKYANTSGDVRTNDTIRTGSDMYLIKSYLKVEVVPIANTSIVDSLPMALLHFKITAVGGNASWKQLAVNMAFGDQLPDNNLVLKNFRLFEGTTDRTNRIQFYDKDGAIDSLYGESDTKLFVSWVGGSNEDVILKGTSKEYWLYATPTGFTTADGDALQVSVASDPSGTLEYNQLTIGSTGQQAKLKNAAGSVQSFNFIWSDISAGSAHSANGVLGSADFFSGEYTTFVSTQIFSR